MVVAKLVEDSAGCKWETQKVVKLPPYFKDYSDMDIHEESGRIVVTSQEDAALWVGNMNMTTFEIEGEGTVLHFPRSSDGCQMIYCNIEGVQILDECVALSCCRTALPDTFCFILIEYSIGSYAHVPNAQCSMCSVRIMTVSDKAKKDQPWQCVAKDQSIQIFALPRHEL